MKNKKGQQEMINWGVGIVILLILIFVFYQIGKSFCETDPTFCGIWGSLIAAAIIGAIFFLRGGR